MEAKSLSSLSASSGQNHDLLDYRFAPTRLTTAWGRVLPHAMGISSLNLARS